MEGFISTSGKKDLEVLMKFAENAIFEIVVPDDSVDRRDDETDFGFMSVVEYSFYPSEDEYLFNALNVFKILSVEERALNENISVQWVTLEYGSLASAVRRRKEPAALTVQEERLVINYEYYTRRKKNIRNLGDCLFE